MASPPAPQPWQKYTFRAGETLKEAVFSSWNGHSPLRLPPPAERSVTCSEITSSIDVRSRTRAMSSSLILPATDTSPPILPRGYDNLRLRETSSTAGPCDARPPLVTIVIVAIVLAS